MATDLAVLKTRLENLKDARASGVLENEASDGRRVRYKSDNEMRNAIAALEQQIAALEGSAAPRNLTVIANKGW